MIFRFFGGKGGVGKTTCAAATALARADAGASVLVVSTDPAHSLGDALGARLSASPKRVAPRLSAAELDADRALDDWLDERKRLLRTIALRGTYLDEDDVDRFLALSLPGVDELMGLHELLRVARASRYDEVVVDTAPTGHTLRLLAMPDTLLRIARVLEDMQGKHRLMAQSLGGAVRLDDCDRLIQELAGEADELIQLLRDPARAQFSWVTLPERLAIEETKDAIAALASAGIAIGELVVNRATPTPPKPCQLCNARRQAEAAALKLLMRPARVIEALDEEPRGLDRLRAFGQRRKSAARPVAQPPAMLGRPVHLAASPELRLLVFAGKGGVGKTTCSAAAALVLAENDPKRRILLLSTDPAHSLGDALAMPVGDEPRKVTANLTVRELDAEKTFAARREEYRQAVDELFDALRGGSRFDAAVDRQIVHDLIDFAPPGLDELLATLAIIDALEQHDLVVLDTAPTGHALRLLALPEAALEWVHTLLEILLKYQGALGLGRLAEELLQLARGLRGLRELCADARRTRVVAVTRPAALPRVETGRLLFELARLGIAVSAVLVNAVTPPGCDRCLDAAEREAVEIAALPRARAILAASAVAPPPRGAAALREFGRTWTMR